MSINNLLIDSLKLRLKEKEEENLRLLKQLNILIQSRQTPQPNQNTTVYLVSNVKNQQQAQAIKAPEPTKPTPPPAEPKIEEPKKKRTRKRKPFFEVSSEQKRLTKKEIASSVDKLNNEVGSLGLAIGSVTFMKKEEKSAKYEMNFVQETVKERNSVEKNKIFKSTIAKDLANLSDRNYHLFRTTLNLPISNLHQVKIFKKELNNMFTIKSNSLGVYLNPMEKIRFVVKKYIENNEIEENETLILKLGGDGTNISKANLKLLNFTFTCINEKSVAKTSKGNYILGIYQIDDEKYNDLEVALKEILDSIRGIDSIEIDGKVYPIKFCMGGDMKFLAIMYGINSANSSKPCIWCKCDKKNFGDLDKDWSIIDKDKGARSLKEAEIKCAEKKVINKLGYVKKPIIDFIDFDRCVIDLLHLFLRITDRLMDLLLSRLKKLDKNDSDDLNLRPNFKKLMNFLKTKCKLTNPYYIKDKKVYLRTFNGKEKFEICEKINIPELFSVEKEEDIEDFKNIGQIWREFFNIYVSIKACEKNHTEYMEDLSKQLKTWLVLYIKLNGSESITPYIHAFVFHLPEFIKIHKNVNLFNMQGLEKLNDFMTRSYHSSTNKHLPEQQYLFQLMKKRNRLEYFGLGGDCTELDSIFNKTKKAEENIDIIDAVVKNDQEPIKLVDEPEDKMDQDN